LPDIILYHYPETPFGEKIRKFLGYKRLEWRSALVPLIRPRPLLEKLTGGNRRIPVLQIGADIYLDTNLILPVIDRLFPNPPLAGTDGDPLSTAIPLWFEPRMFMTVNPLRFQSRNDMTLMGSDPQRTTDFVAERAPFMASMLDTSKLRDHFPAAAFGFRQLMTLLDRRLLATRGFLGGDFPSPADFSAYHPIWWLLQPPAHEEILEGFDNVRAWLQRIGNFGDGKPSPISVEDAFEHARMAEPVPPGTPPAGDARLKLGSLYRIAPNDYGKDPVEGTLVHVGENELTLAREHEELGRVHIHFPRWGYTVSLPS
jgi:glutathione S-transferase